MFAPWRGLQSVNLGASYHRLWSASAVSHLGDGVYLAALPLLAASLTRDPLLVSVVSATGWLPWLLFGLPAGALVDRWDRRRVMWRVDAARCVIVGVLAVAVWVGWASIPLLAAMGFLLGAGQTLYDSAAQSVLPALVERDQARLERANSQLIGAQQVNQGLAGQPLGGLLTSIAHAVPFAADAVSFLASSVLIYSIPGRFAAEHKPVEPIGLRAEILEGLRWLLHSRLFRAMALLVGAGNLIMSAGGAILVLLAQQRLGLGSCGFGVLLSSGALGGVMGSTTATRASRLLGPGTVFIGSLIIGGAAQAAIGATTTPLTAVALMAAQGALFTMFNIIAVTLRQTIVPDRLMGRVVSANRVLVFGAVPLGSILGGVLGKTLGVTSPFLLGGATLVILALAALPAINNHSIKSAQADAAASRELD